MKSIVIFFLFTVFIVSGRAEIPYKFGNDEIFARRLQVRQDAMQHLLEDNSQIPIGTKEKKLSIGKAVIFSLVVPGTGQFYANSYIKAAVFFAVEVGAWTVNVSYRKKGDDKDSEFKDFADTRWEEYRYWSYVNWVAINNPNYDDFPLVRGDLVETVGAPNGGNWYLINSDYYNANRDQLLAILREIEQIEFSHQLPTSKTQQYYEMIGKYPGQFGNAWDDASFDREYSGPSNITANNDYYMTMRDESNRFYDVAQYGLMVAMINHVISAIDAGFTARGYNRRTFGVEMSYENIDYKGEYVNMVGLNVKW